MDDMELEVISEVIQPIDPLIDKLRDELGEAVQSGEEFSFRRVLNDYFDESTSTILSALESYHPVHHMSVFEMACYNNGDGDNIEDCITVGCDVNRRNPKCGRRPISFAIECTSFCGNMESLLSDTSVNVDLEHSIDFPFTPLNYLLEQLLDKDIDKDFLDCNNDVFDYYFYIEFLVQHCADVNIPGKDGRTPIRSILDMERLSASNKKKLVQCFFDHSKYVDIDDENGAIRAQLNELMPDLELPPVGIQRDRKFDYDYLLQTLESRNEGEFWQYFKVDYDEFKGTLVDRWKPFLCTAVLRGLNYTTERILRMPSYVSHCAAGCGWFFTNQTISSLMSSIKYGKINDPNVDKCFDLLLSHQKFYIHEKCIGYRLALRDSIDTKCNVTTKLILERGAYIAFDFISNIKPQLLEIHFNSCISTYGAHVDSGDLRITFNFKNLIPVRSKVRSSFEDLSEMQAVECIMQSCTIRHLLKHPLIESFLDMKWKRLALIFYCNFFFCALSAVLNIFYILVFFLDERESLGLRVVCQMLLLCLIAREMFQIISSPRMYFKNLQNYLECALIGLSAFILFGNCPIGWRGNVAAVAILLIAFEFTVLIGSLPLRSITTHYVMLETVTTNFVKSLLLYSTIIVAFALAFRSLFHQSEAINAKMSNETEADEDRYNNFQSVALSMLKSMVMANGELDTSSINFNGSPLSYIVFVAFVLFVTTVLGNLLNGLAVSDINEIQSQAELTHLIRRCQLLVQYEKVFRENSTWLTWFPKLKRVVRCKMFLNPDFRFAYQREIEPNAARNKWSWYMRRISCCDQHYQMDEDIVKEAFDRANLGINEENDIEMLRNEIAKIEESLVHEIRSMRETVKSMERMLEDRVPKTGHDWKRA